MKFRACLLALGWGLLASAGSAAVFVVDSTGDEPDADLADGLCRTAVNTCTLRAAIEQANFSVGADVVQFAIPGTGVRTISPMSPLPPLTDDAGITIDGYSQPGASPNTLTVGDDAVLRVELDGTNVGVPSRGFVIRGVGSVIRGVIINRFSGFGISVEGGYSHEIRGCFIGTDPTGTVASPNLNGIVINTSGAAVGPPSPSALPWLVTIGGGLAADRNVISGNGCGGIGALATRVLIQGNYIGTDATGKNALPNLCAGVDVSGTATVEGNLISGNGGGIVSSGGNLFIVGNLIGTDANGTAKLGNGSGIQLTQDVSSSILSNVISGNGVNGVVLSTARGTVMDQNWIGTDVNRSLALGNGGVGVLVRNLSSSVQIGSGIGNVVAFNGGTGVQIGSSSDDATNDVRIASNSIHDNGGLGIDLGGDRVTPDNDCDAGRGPNLGQNFPVLDFAGIVPGGTRIAGSLNSVPGVSYRIDFYSNGTCDPSGYGEGEAGLGSTTVTTDASCLALFDVVLPATVAAGSVITATATDPAGNTSEFSACRALSTGRDFFTIVPCRVADTRDPDGPYGGPALAVGSDRTFVVAGQCGIPSDAQAVALNVAVTMPTAAGDVRLFASGTLMPMPPAINYAAGQTRARGGIFALGLGGGIDAHVDQSAGTVQLILDVTGYFR